MQNKDSEKKFFDYIIEDNVHHITSSLDRNRDEYSYSFLDKCDLIKRDNKLKLLDMGAGVGTHGIRLARRV